MRKQTAASHKKSTRKPGLDPKQEKRKRAAKAHHQSDQELIVSDFREETIGLTSHANHRWAPPQIQLALPGRRGFSDELL